MPRPRAQLPSQRIGRFPVETLELADLVTETESGCGMRCPRTFDRSTVNQCTTPGGAEVPATARPAEPSPFALPTAPASTTGGRPVRPLLSSRPVPPSHAQEGISQDRSCTATPTLRPARQRKVQRQLGQPRAAIPSIIWMWRAAAGLPNEDNKDFADSDMSNGFIQVRSATCGNLLRERQARWSCAMLTSCQAGAARCARVTGCLATMRRRNGDVPLGAASRTTTRRLSRRPAFASAGWVIRCRRPRPADATLPRILGSRLPISMDAIDPSLGRCNWCRGSELPPRSGGQTGSTWSSTVSPPSMRPTAPPACATCLTIDPPGHQTRPVVVLVAGQALAGQIRGTGTPASAYLEAGNATGYRHHSGAWPELRLQRRGGILSTGQPSARLQKQPPAGGFTLVEMAVVLLVVALILGSILVPLERAGKAAQRLRDPTHLEETRQALSDTR